jgi:hypothetical protein
VVLASLAAAIAAFSADIRTAYLWAGPSVFSETDRRQMAAVRGSVPAGEAILLLAGADDAWYARLWQRGLYPRNRVIALIGPTDAVRIRRLRERHGIRSVVVIGKPPDGAFLGTQRDLGPIPGWPSRVSFGEFLP